MTSSSDQPLEHTATVSSPSALSSPQWSSGLQATLDQPPAKLPIYLAFAGSVFALVFAGWAWFGRVDEVAQATGKLIPQGEVHKVHPLESGNVVRVAVQEGQVVQAGQVLLELDSALATKEIERLQTLQGATQQELNQTQLLLDKTQLQSETKAAIAQTEIQAKTVLIAQTDTAATHKASVLDQLRQDAQQQQVRLERLQTLSREGAVTQEYVFGLEQGLRDRQRSITEGEGAWQANLADTERLQVELRQKQAEAVQTQLQAQQDLRTLQLRLTELNTKLKETQVLLATAQTKRNRHWVYAPAAGTVLTLNVRQSGEVVQPGQTIAEIAPQHKPLVLSTQLPSHAAGFVKPGMPVKIKLDAYPYQDYGIVAGHVVSISPDSKPIASGEQAYRVEIGLKQQRIQAKGQTLKFRAGQTATAEIVTRQRQIADIFLDPIKKLRANAPQ
jgi:hemolysin D